MNTADYRTMIFLHVNSHGYTFICNSKLHNLGTWGTEAL